MKILIDMNLSPAWVSVLEEAGHTASHWSTIGSLNAPDREVLLWAKANGYLLFTHDLDFGAILAATEAEGPSVIQIRAQDISPDHSPFPFSFLFYSGSIPLVENFLQKENFHTG